MDLAFDSQNRLWTTTQNQLWIVDTQTGVGTFVPHIYGVPDADPPRNMEVMSIAFDKHDNLHATAMTTFWDDPNGSPAMKINTRTGQATLLDYTHQYYNHGGEIMPTRVTVVHIMPTKVTVAHLMPNGHFKTVTIGIDAPPAHLAHGDYVPGTVGDPNYPDLGRDQGVGNVEAPGGWPPGGLSGTCIRTNCFNPLSPATDASIQVDVVDRQRFSAVLLVLSRGA
jgi:hypothetical protein